MAKFKSTVSALKSAKSKTKKTKSAATRTAKVKSRSAARPRAKVSAKSAIASAARRDALDTKGAADPTIELGTRGAIAEAPSAISGIAATEVPFGEALDAEQQRLRNAPEGANIYDLSIGYGIALPGESGVAAVERIKAERGTGKKAKVKRTRRK